MHSRVPRAARVPLGRLPSDRAPARKATAGSASPALTKVEQDIARPQHLTPEERTLRNLRYADVVGNLAAMCFEQTGGIDLTVPADRQHVPHGWSRQPTTAGTVAGAQGFPAAGRHARPERRCAVRGKKRHTENGFEAWCYAHDKALYRNRKVARARIRAIGDRGMRAYRCDTAPRALFHIGHLPVVVRRGTHTAGQIYGGTS